MKLPAISAALLTLLVSAPAAAEIPDFDPNNPAEPSIATDPLSFCEVIPVDPTSAADQTAAYYCETPALADVVDAFSAQAADVFVCADEERVRRGYGPGASLGTDVFLTAMLWPDGGAPAALRIEFAAESTDMTPQFEPCLRAAFESAQFPSFSGPPAIFEYMFDFSPEAGMTQLTLTPKSKPSKTRRPLQEQTRPAPRRVGAR